MSYQYRILKDFPVTAFPLNPGETGGFADISGNTVASTIYGTIPERPPLVVGGGSSRLVSTSNGFNFLAYNPLTSESFTLEVWFKPVAPGTIQVIGHSGVSDGIIWDGEALSFTTLYGAAGAATVSYYPPDFNDAWCIQGVHTPDKNQLYVNGILVGEVDISDAQKAAGFSSTGALYIGKAITGTPTGVVDGVAMYLRALDASACEAHYIWGISVQDMKGIVSSRGGRYWTMNDSETVVAYREDYSDAEDWSAGITSGLNFSSDILKPRLDTNGVTLASSWATGIILENMASVLDGSKVEWDGDGNFTVEASMDDGTSWTTCINGREIPGISENFTTLGKSVVVRVTFPAGEPSTTLSKIRRLSLVFYSSRDFLGNALTRTFTTSGSVAIDSGEHQPIQYNDNWGTRFYNGTGVISSDVNGEVTRTVEAWFKINTLPGSAKTIIDTRAAGSTGNGAWTLNGGTLGSINSIGTAYLNGTTPVTAIVANQWYHAVLVLPADVITPVTVATDYLKGDRTDVTFGLVSVYPTAMTAAQVSTLYNSYLGAAKSSIVDESTATVSEFIPAVKMYNPGWSVNPV